MQRYHVPNTITDQNEIQLIKKRVATLILQWVKKDLLLFDTSLVNKIKYFAEATLAGDKLESLAARICQEIQKLKDVKNSVAVHAVPTKSPIYELKGISPESLILCAEPSDVADQLILIDLEIFSRIEIIELIGQKWVKESTQVLARNVVHLITRVNRIAYWVGTTILLQEKLADRTKAIIFFVYLAQNLFQKNNFNSLIGVLAGLNLAAISRLRVTLSSLKKNIQEHLDSLLHLQNPEQNFKHLREAMKKGGFNAVPYLGLYLQDLSRIDEGNPPEVIIAGRELINFPKYSLNETAIFNLLIHQKAITHFTENIKPLEPLKTFLQEMPLITEKELHMLSLEREPRGCNPKDIL
jgi:hypothetical protein